VTGGLDGNGALIGNVPAGQLLEIPHGFVRNLVPTQVILGARSGPDITFVSATQHSIFVRNNGVAPEPVEALTIYAHTVIE
jgi:hypothetical protein